MHVLLVDADPQLRAWLTQATADAGHTLTTVGDAVAAWAAFAAEPPRLLVLAMELPGSDGLALCRRLRAAPGGAGPYVLAITARDGDDALAAVLDAGADDYLSRPGCPAALAARLAIAERRIAADAARRSAEEALARARYFAGIGETSLALQHEINNPLAALLGHAALIEQGLIEPGEEREMLHVIVEQAHRIAGVVKRLSAMRHPRSVEYLEGEWMLDLSREEARAARATGEFEAIPAPDGPPRDPSAG